MAEQILSSIAQEILKNLSSRALQEFATVLGVKDELKKLKISITTVKDVLLDAEEKQKHSRSVARWLERLKHVAYDADDLLDQVATKALLREAVKHTITRPFRDFGFSSKIAPKVKEIREKLDLIAQDRQQLELAVVNEDRRISSSRREEISYVRSSEVIGRKADLEKIIKLLLNPREENVCVIPIVGMGGLGKTTLAQLVYNDEKVEQNFTKRIWVCISEDFDLKIILEKIMEDVTSQACSNLGIEQLQRRLRDELNNKKYLLVLDDVWNEDHQKWKDLINLLLGGANGSRILVTTRNKIVASIVSMDPPYELKGIPEDECLSLLLRCASLEGKEKEHPELVEIGRSIVIKCKGIPLAARTLGSQLYHNTEICHWQSLTNNEELWKSAENDILPILKSSYNQLPSNLKKCLAYCSLIDKDDEIDKEKLIQQWMAHGFIQYVGFEEPEDIGNRYFNELVGRSFFQEVKETSYYTTTCKMHDLVHDLAKSVAGEECKILDFSAKLVPEDMRHTSFDYEKMDTFHDPLRMAKKLRSFILRAKCRPVLGSFVEVLISSFTYLRVLDLSYSNLKELPDSVGKLTLLRYVDLTANSPMEKLPISVCKLLNLQTLNLHLCRQLQELPAYFGKLTRLRHFSISPKFNCLPKEHIQSLTSLRTLSITRSETLTNLSEGIQCLTSLTKLVIILCSNLESLPKGMEKLECLKTLFIGSCQALKFTNMDFKGLVSLHALTLSNLPYLEALPGGLEDATSSLTYLIIEGCKKMETLPEWLKKFKSLRKLVIRNCPNLQSLPEIVQHLTTLRHLEITHCPHLSRRCKMETGKDWSQIKHVHEIYIDGKRCPEL